MRAPYTQLYLHLVWAAWDRLPLITELANHGSTLPLPPNAVSSSVY